MRKFTIAAAALMLVAQGLRGQNIDPTVEVTRDYEAKLIEVHKPLFTIPVADSLQRFDLEIDYSVYDSPYKGTYEFNPYLVNMTPETEPYSGTGFWLKAGAGYALQPVLDFVWTPGLEGRFRMNVYGTHRSYIGRYRSISGVQDGNVLMIDDPGRAKYDGVKDRYDGYDMLTRAGVNGSVGWNGGSFSFDASYYGVAMKNPGLKRGYDAFDVKLGVASDDAPGRKFVYDAALRYRFGEDKADYTSASGYLGEHLFGLKGFFGPVFSQTSKLLVSLDMNLADYTAPYRAYAGDVAVTPRFVYKNKRWNLDLGVKVAFTVNNTGKEQTPIYEIASGQLVYPDVRIGFEMVKKKMEVYLDVDGGNNVMSWSGFLADNHYFNQYSYGRAFLGNTVERLRAELGFDGNLFSRLGYDLKVGYVNYANAFLDGVRSDNGTLFYAPGFAAYQMFYAGLGLKWESKAFSADGAVTYNFHSDVLDRTVGLFAPATVSGWVNLKYNWNKRVYAGVDCRFATGRKGEVLSADSIRGVQAKIPGYVDLGVSGEYWFSPKFSLWVHGGNLLNMAVQRVPLYAESGINFTAGICLNF